MPTDEKTYTSVCRNCHGGCSALLTVRGGKLVSVRPAPGSPFNLGQMCPKGLATPEMVHHPDRLTVPLKRDGARGSNRWQETSWDTALSEIAERLNAIRTEHRLMALSIDDRLNKAAQLHSDDMADRDF